MIDPVGPRPFALPGHAAVEHKPAATDLVTHPETAVLPVEAAEPIAPTGPRPAFAHTYLEWARSFWPEEPEGHSWTAWPEAGEPSRPDARSREQEGFDLVKGATAAEPAVDLRR